MRPFVESGISFRPWVTPASLSRRGYVVGGGLQFRKGTFVIEPTVRFTRWPGFPTFQSQANQNQLQVLLGVHRAMPSGLQGRLNQKLSLGVLGGFSFLNDYADKDGLPGYRSKLVGVAFDYRLAPKWSVEVDALYHPLILSERAQATVITGAFRYWQNTGCRHDECGHSWNWGPTFALQGTPMELHPPTWVERLVLAWKRCGTN